MDSTNSGNLFEGHGVMANGTRILGAPSRRGDGQAARDERGRASCDGRGGIAHVCFAPAGDGCGANDSGSRHHCERHTLHHEPRAMCRRDSQPDGCARDAFTGSYSGSVVGKSLRIAPLIEDGSGLPPNSPVRFEAPDYPDEGSAMVGGPPRPEPDNSPSVGQSTSPSFVQASASLLPRTPKMAFVLGRIGYDLVGDTRRLRLAEAITQSGLSGDPEDMAVLAALISRRSSIAQEVTWLVMRDSSPLYAAVVTGPSAQEILASLASGASAQVSGAIDEMSFPGVVTERWSLYRPTRQFPSFESQALVDFYGWSRSEQLARVALPPAGREELNRMLAFIDSAEPNGRDP